jgi:hypothetical protein
MCSAAQWRVQYSPAIKVVRARKRKGSRRKKKKS